MITKESAEFLLQVLSKLSFSPMSSEGEEQWQQAINARNELINIVHAVLPPEDDKTSEVT